MSRSISSRSASVAVRNSKLTGRKVRNRMFGSPLIYETGPTWAEAISVACETDRAIRAGRGHEREDPEYRLAQTMRAPRARRILLDDLDRELVQYLCAEMVHQPCGRVAR